MPPDRPNALAALMPRMQEEFGDHVSPEFLLVYRGSCELAIAYSGLFWPEFTIVAGLVLTEGATQANVDHWLSATKGDARAVQAVMNHIHITDLHDSECNEAQARYLGRMLQRIYTAKLRQDFPDRTFIVRFNDVPGLDVADYQVTFWELRPDGT